MVTMPTGLPYGTVKGRFLFVDQDKADVDTDPDFTLVTGTVRFICSATKPLKAASAGVSLIPLVFDATFDSEGHLVPVGDTSLTRGLKLPASNSTVYNPTGFTWRVEFNLMEASTGNAVQIEPFHIYVNEGVVHDLVTEMPAGVANGTAITRGDPGVLRVLHGTNGELLRPDVESVVYWIGTARPVNALPYDWWLSI